MPEISMLICPKCGKTSDNVEFIGPFCSECHEFKVKEPKTVVIERCGRCGRVWLGREWVKFNKKAIEEIVARKFKGDFDRVDYDLDSGTAIVYFRIGDRTYPIEKKFEVKWDRNICPDCSRISGGYFEAIVQFRGTRKKREHFAESMKHMLSKTTFVNKVVERKEGVDLYVGSTKAVIGLLKELGWTHRISRKLAGQREGRRVYRTTFVIRFGEED